MLLSLLKLMKTEFVTRKITQIKKTIHSLANLPKQM
jgi:hypothetical protein